MSRHRRSPRRPAPIRVALVALCGSVAVGSWALAPDRDHAPAGRPATVGSGPAAPPGVVAPPQVEGVAPVPAGAGVAIAAPVRLRVPAIGIDARLDTVSLRPDGTLAVPGRWDRPAWYSGGPRPGEAGPAVIAGHVDSVSGPAVFFRLSRLRVGAVVYVAERTGPPLRFVVDDVATFSKTRFPTAFVYGPQPIPVLRLITCTGVFDRARSTYLDNLVVSAHVG